MNKRCLMFIEEFNWDAYLDLSLYWPTCPCFHPLSHTPRAYQLWPERRESIIPISCENSRSVIALSQAIKLLPQSDRWLMLEGLFIFCLLIRAARRGGGTVRCRHTRGKQGGLTERQKQEGENTLFQEKQQLLLIIQHTVQSQLLIYHECMWAAWHVWCGSSVIRQGYVKGSQPTEEWISVIIRPSESPVSCH